MTRRQLTQVVTLALVCLIAGSAFGGMFVSWRFLPVVVVAVVGATVVSVAAWRSGWSIGWAALASIIAYMVVGALVVFWPPSPDAPARMAGSSVRAWRSLLTFAVPVDPPREVLVVPYLTAWAGTFTGIECVLRRRHLLAPAAGPMLIILVAGLFGTAHNRGAGWLGLALVPSLIAFLLLRSEKGWVWRSRPERAGLARRAGGVAGTLVFAATGGLLVGPSLSPVAGAQRTTLRDVVPPPFEIENLRTPLSSFKDSLRDDAANDVVMVVSGSDLAGRRIRLAALDEYDGVAWTTASRDTGQLVPVGQRFPGLIDQWSGPSARFEFTLRNLSGNWLPTIGATQSISWGPSARAAVGDDDPQEHLRVDPKNGNLVLDRTVKPASDRPGIAYSVEAIDQPADEDLVGDSVAPLPTMSSNLTADYVALANDIVGQESVDLNKITRIEEALGRYRPDGAGPVSSTGGGKNPTYDLFAPPGQALYRVNDLLRGDEDEYRGTAEQYATTFAVLAAAVGIPSRVVVGYVVDESLVEPAVGAGQPAPDAEVANVRRSDLTAWVEVPFVDAGWVMFTAGPDESATPKDRPAAGGGLALQAPPLPPLPPEQPLTVETESEEAADAETCQPSDCSEDLAAGTRVPVVVVYGSVGLLLPALLASAVGGGIAYLKVRRRRRRRQAGPAASVAGAWFEFLDAERDAGRDVPIGRTPRQTLASLQLGPEIEPVADLSRLVELSAYSAAEPTPEAAVSAWRYVEALDLLRSNDVPRWRRLWRRLNLRSLVEPAG